MVDFDTAEQWRSLLSEDPTLGLGTGPGIPWPNERHLLFISAAPELAADEFPSLMHAVMENHPQAPHLVPTAALDVYIDRFSDRAKGTILRRWRPDYHNSTILNDLAEHYPDVVREILISNPDPSFRFMTSLTARLAPDMFVDKLRASARLNDPSLFELAMKASPVQVEMLAPDVAEHFIIMDVEHWWLHDPDLVSRIAPSHVAALRSSDPVMFLIGMSKMRVPDDTCLSAARQSRIVVR